MSPELRQLQEKVDNLFSQYIAEHKTSEPQEQTTDFEKGNQHEQGAPGAAFHKVGRCKYSTRLHKETMN